MYIWSSKRGRIFDDWTFNTQRYFLIIVSYLNKDVKIEVEIFKLLVSIGGNNLTTIMMVD